MPHLHRWNQPKGNNPFTPEFDISLWVDDLPEVLIDELMVQVLLHEDEGLYDNDRWEHYNIFQWEGFAVKELQEMILTSYEAFCNSLHIEKEERIWVRGWVYPQKPEIKVKRRMNIGRHQHAMHENAFLSGVLNLQDHFIGTDYDIPYVGWTGIGSKKGRLTLAPSSLPHAVKALRYEDVDRYTIAFDLITQKGMDHFWFSKLNNDTSKDPLNLAIEL